jgi:membrane associated rhomboid family serine protease
MAGFFTEINRRFNAGTIAAKFIYINVGVFILIRLSIIVFRLFMKEAHFLTYLEMPSNPELFVYRPWTIITYMFVHIDFLHILFNMLWLYWFGKIFLQFFTGRQLGGLYVLGGVAGAALFLVAYNTFPYLKQMSTMSYLAGASASVMAIVFAVSFYRKNYTINLLLIGRIKLIYVALVVLLIDILAITSENAGGHIAHIGGALLGICYAAQYEKGKDFTGFINRQIDRFVNLFKRKPVFKVYRTGKPSSRQKARHPETDDAYLRRKQEENRVIDEILDKLKKSGYESLSADEKKRLFDASR